MGLAGERRHLRWRAERARVIRKQDILDRAGEWALRPEVVEKDYVLGWLLAAFTAVEEARAWIFKGGTCIKKCYLETYRFSEDLDFSLLPQTAYTEEAILGVLRRIARAASELSGVQFPENLIEVRSRRNQQGMATFEGRVPYSGPLVYPGFPRIRFDITQHEPVFDIVAERGVFHPYPDELPSDANVAAYSFDELLAEKTRALYERARPRDLYDVVYLLDNCPNAFDLGRVHDLFEKKCRAKNLPVPSSEALAAAVRRDDELRSEWSNMLAHQIPALPDLGELVERLLNLIKWIDEPAAPLPEARLEAAPTASTETPLASPGIRFWGGGLPIEAIRFAGANRLLVEFDYDHKHRVVEPYSLRRALTGNTLLYAWEQSAGHVKAFNVAKIHGLRVTTQNYRPRYRVELAEGSLLAPTPVRLPPSADGGHRRSPSGRRLPSRLRGSAPTYVFQCPYCGKTFRRATNAPSLRAHKMKDGYTACPGRRGHLLSIR